MQNLIFPTLPFQTLDQDISKNHVDLDKMRHLLQSFPSTPHLTLNTGKMEVELHEMEATVHTLTARIQVGGYLPFCLAHKLECVHNYREEKAMTDNNQCYYFRYICFGDEYHFHLTVPNLLAS